MANKTSKNNKKTVDFSVKREKKTKEFLLFDVNLYELIDGLVDGKYEVIDKEVRRFGKRYYKVNNVISSL